MISPSIIVYYFVQRLIKSFITLNIFAFFFSLYIFHIFIIITSLRILFGHQFAYLIYKQGVLTMVLFYLSIFVEILILIVGNFLIITLLFCVFVDFNIQIIVTFFSLVKAFNLSLHLTMVFDVTLLLQIYKSTYPRSRWSSCRGDLLRSISYTWPLVF